MQSVPLTAAMPLEGHPVEPAPSWADTSVRPQTQKEPKEKTHPHNPSHVRDTATPSGEETSVLKRKKHMKTPQILHLATLSKTFLDSYLILTL